MWAQIAGLAVNALGQDQQKSQQERMAKEQAERDNINKNRMWQDQQKINVDQQVANQRGNNVQQQVFNDIMQKYNVRL